MFIPHGKYQHRSRNMHVMQVNITARHSANVARGILASIARVEDGLDPLVHANKDLIDRPRALLHRVEVDVPCVDGGFSTLAKNGSFHV